MDKPRYWAGLTVVYVLLGFALALAHAADDPDAAA